MNLSCMSLSNAHSTRPNRYRIILASLLAAAAILGATSQPWAAATTTLEATELKTIFTDLVTRNSALPPGDIEISHFSANPESLRLPPGIQDVQIVSQNKTKPLGRQTIVADILVDGALQERVSLSGDVELYGEVVCAKKTLARRAIIEASDLEVVRRNLGSLGPELVDDPAKAIGMELNATMQPGAVLYNRFLKSPETVKRGDIVSIQAANGALSISVPGRVQTAGAKGDLIKVKNLMSRREVFARVVGPETVQVEL